MKSFMKYTLLLVALIMSVYQSAHILEHAIKDQQTQSEHTYHSLQDHSCTICHFNLHTVVPVHTEYSSPIEEALLQHDQTVYRQQVKQSILFKQRSLRAPPAMI